MINALIVFLIFCMFMIIWVTTIYSKTENFCKAYGIKMDMKWYHYFGVSRFKEIANCRVFELTHDRLTNRFYAGCRNFNYQQAISHWNYSLHHSQKYHRQNRAMIFLKALNDLPEKYKK